MLEIHRTERGARLFFAYKIQASLCNVRRSGFALWGINPKYDPEPFFEGREQSDAEHVGGLVSLIHLLYVFYPQIVSRERFEDFIFWATIHELGELSSGDIPADGTRDDVKKDRDEGIYIANYLDVCFPKDKALEGKTLFAESQMKSTTFGQDAYLCDKIDPILRGLVYEADGRKSSKEFKESLGRLTEQDHKCIQITGSEQIADNFLCSVLLNNGCAHFDHIDSFLEIVQSATYAVRGEEMTWLNHFLKNNHRE